MFFTTPQKMAMDSEGVYIYITYIYIYVYIMSSLLIVYNNKSYVTASVPFCDDFLRFHFNKKTKKNIILPWN